MQPFRMTMRLLFVGLLLLLGVACGGASEPNAGAAATAQPTAVEATAIGATAQATAAAATALPTVEPTAELLDPTTLGTDYADYRSYQLQITWTLIDSTTAAENDFVTVQISKVADPPAEQIVMTNLGAAEAADADTPQALLMVRLGDTQYMSMGAAGCISVPATDEAPAGVQDDLLDADELLGDLRSARRVLPNVTVNGVETRHYRFDEQAYARLSTTPELDIDGELFVSVRDNQLVRMVMTGYDPQVRTMAGELFEEGDRFRLTYDILSINQPLTIELPAGCSPPGTSGYPRPDDAFEAATFGNMESYKTNLSVDETIAFYQAALGDLGWDYLADNATVMGSSAFIYFAQEGRQLQIILNNDGSATSVTLMAPGEE